MTFYIKMYFKLFVIYVTYVIKPVQLDRRFILKTNTF